MRQLKYSEYRGANKLLFFELNAEIQIETVRAVVAQVDPDAIVEYLGYDESRDKHTYTIIIYNESYACEDRIVAYEALHQD